MSPRPLLLDSEFEDKDMTKTLAEKTCTPCRDGIPPLTRNEGKQDRKPGEFVRRLPVPKLPPATHFRAYKITKRIDEDISADIKALAEIAGISSDVARIADRRMVADAAK